MKLSLTTIVLILLSGGVAMAQEPATPLQFDALPVNPWSLLHSEDASGGKWFSRAVWAENVDALYLWGTGGRKPARNVYERYELESFDPRQANWQPAFPSAADGKWSPKSFPPFRIYGQTGPDGLKYDEGPRLQVVGGYNQAAALNDTWVYVCDANRWEQRKPQSAPPPMEAPAATMLPDGRVLICGYDARLVQRDHWHASSASPRW